jgi:DNA-binding NtrC family response regulator
MTTPDWDAARTLINERKIQPDVIFIDPLSSHRESEDLEDICRELGSVPIVILTTLSDPKSVVKAIRSGARDYLLKPFDIQELDHTIDEITRKIPKNECARERPTKKDGKVEFIFCNPRMKEILDTILQIANARIPVLLQGESGVGKDIVARTIHQHSQWCNRPFVKVNCAAMPAELAESELFGYEKGAFTGAYIDRPGKFEFANGGTVFLDEIAEFTPSTQAKLLQVLQDGKFSRLGSNQEVEVDVRVIAATNQRLEETIEKGSFRKDLYYRLNVVNIEIPPLRKRKDEISFYCQYFLEKFGKYYNAEVRQLPEELYSLFETYHWPGNIRELENIIKRYVVLGDTESIRLELETKTSRQTSEELDELVDIYLEENEGDLFLKEIGKRAAAVVERNMISKTLRKTNWNKWAAAKELKVSYKTLLTKIEQYEIRPAI